jgi:hypothetical protein
VLMRIGSFTRLTMILLILSWLFTLLIGCSHTPPVSPPSRAAVSPAPLTSVVKVQDGDTIIVLSQNTAQRLRLAGIDCPESDQPYGAEATETTKALALNIDVTITPITTDRYGTHSGGSDPSRMDAPSLTNSSRRAHVGGIENTHRMMWN